MTPRDIRVSLADATRACERIARFTARRTEEDFVEDDLLRSATERQFTILGEALAQARKLQPGLSLPELERIIGFRNRLIHSYDTVDPRIVWNIAQTHTPRLLKALREMGSG
ncbi:MAG: DUF86 domain-containing protein [Actinomycetota bacterium]